MNTIKIIFLALLFSGLASSCNKEDELGDVNNIPGLGGDTWVQGPIDKWVNDNLTLPYNISTKYKWDQGELQADFDKTLTPPKEEKVIPLMSSIKTAWIDTYIAEAGALFFKTISLFISSLKDFYKIKYILIFLFSFKFLGIRICLVPLFGTRKFTKHEEKKQVEIRCSRYIFNFFSINFHKM